MSSADYAIGAEHWICWSDAIDRIARLIEEPAGKVRHRKAAGALYDRLRRGNVRSRAGRVDSKNAPGWFLGIWSIPAEVWQGVTLYDWPRKVVTWSWPANLEKPNGWPTGPADAVRLTEIEILADDIEPAAASLAATRTGLPGRPTSRHLWEAEFGRRLQTGTLALKVGDEATYLAHWLKTNYPQAPRAEAKTIENAIRREFRRARPKL